MSRGISRIRFLQLDRELIAAVRYKSSLDLRQHLPGRQGRAKKDQEIRTIYEPSVTRDFPFSFRFGCIQDECDSRGVGRRRGNCPAGAVLGPAVVSDARRKTEVGSARSLYPRGGTR